MFCLAREQSGTKLAQAATPTTANPVIYGEFIKHKESLTRPRKQSDDPVRIYENGQFWFVQRVIKKIMQRTI